MEISFYGMSDVGCCRSNNEDTFVLQTIWDNDHILAVVIDGCGGYEGGEHAAYLASQGILDFLKGCSESDDYQEQLRLSVIHANNLIFSRRFPPYERMCCVLTAAIMDLKKHLVHMAHVGDTRCYLHTSNQLAKITRDHSFVGPLEDNGIISEKEAMEHPHRNIITRSVGSRQLDYQTDYVSVDTKSIEYPCELLLCSDGLYDMLFSSEILSVLNENLTTQHKVEKLIEQAKLAGGKDNITVILLYIK